MSTYGHIKQCFELSDADVAQAVESRESTRELLAHLASISKPNTGAAKALLVLARMATTECEWLDGDLRIDLVAKDGGSTLNVVDDLGVGMAERVFPPIAFAVPLDEFLRALERVPERIKPLGVTARGKDRVTLGASVEQRRSSLPPPAVKIADDSVFVPSNMRHPPAPKFDGPPSRAPALPIVNASLPVVNEERVRARSSPPPMRAKAPSEDMIPAVAPVRPASEARMPIAAKKAPSEAMIPIVAPVKLPSEDMIPVVGEAKRKHVPTEIPPNIVPPPPPLARVPLTRAKPKSIAPPKAEKGKSVMPPKTTKGKSIAPKKSVRPKSISPLGGAENEEEIDSGWGEEPE